MLIRGSRTLVAVAFLRILANSPHQFESLNNDCSPFSNFYVRYLSYSHRFKSALHLLESELHIGDLAVATEKGDRFL